MVFRSSQYPCCTSSAGPCLRRALLMVAASAVMLLAAAGAAWAGGGPDNVMIVANSASEDSLAVANTYRTSRQIPQRNLCLINVEPALFRTDQSVDWDVYMADIRGPIVRFLNNHPSPQTIHFIVLTIDLPLRVKMPADGVPANAPTHRSLSSMLTLLPDRPPPVVVPNPYNSKVSGFARWLALTPADRRPAGMRLVTVLSGYSRQDALGLIQRSMEADNTSPQGIFYFIESPHTVGLREAAERLEEEGFEARHMEDLQGVQQFADVMGHFSGGAYSKLTWPQIQSSTIRPGALVDMLQSYGARDLNWRGFGFASHVPVGWWIHAGASGVHGATGEPYAHTFPTSGMLQFLLANYLGGSNLAESYWSSLRQLAWQNVIFGDPLCAPYARRAELELVAHPQEGGQVLLSLQVIMPQGRDISDVRLMIDGKPYNEVEPTIVKPPEAAGAPAEVDDAAAPTGNADPADAAAPAEGNKNPPQPMPTIYRWQISLEGMVPGHHRARAIVLGDTAAAVESQATVDFPSFVPGRMLVLSLAPTDLQPMAAGDQVEFVARYEGQAAPHAILLRRGLETLGVFDANGNLAIETRPLGPGTHEFQAVAVDEQQTPLMVSPPQMLTLVEPLKVLEAWPSNVSGRNGRVALIYNRPLPYQAASLRNAARFIQGERQIPTTVTVEENVLVLTLRAALAAGPAVLEVSLPQRPERSRNFGLELDIADDSDLLYTMPDDIALRSVVSGYASYAGGRLLGREVRPALVAVGPVEVNLPDRPAQWSVPAYQVAATLTIGAAVRKSGPADHGAGLGVHYQDINNYAVVRVEKERVAAYEVVDGKRREVGAWPAAGSTSGNVPMSLTVVGRRVAVSVHGRQVGQFELSETLDHGLPLVDLAAPRGVSATGVQVSRPE